MKLKNIGAVMLCALLAMTFPAKAEENGVTESSIKLGQAAALEGPSAELGKAMKSGLMAAFEEANAAGGINKRKIELVSRDDGYTPDKSVEAVKQLINEDKVFALVGGVGTPTANATIPVAGEAGVPFIGAMTGAKSLRDPKWTHVINLRASYDQETETLIDHLTKDLGIKKIAVFYQNDAYGQAGLSGFKAAMQKRGMEMAAEGTYERNTKDIQAALDTIMAAKPEAVVMVCTYGAGAEFIKQARKQANDTIFANISFVGSNALAQELGEAGHGVVISQVVPSYSDVTVPIVVSYLSAMKKYNPNDKHSFVAFEGYIVGKMVVEALKRIKGDPTRKALLDELSKGNYDIGGFKLAFGNGRTQGSDQVYLTELQKTGLFKSVQKLTRE